ncbi:hypothetical protein SLEP1_g14778 [Rubroshorea leprosula]|uniref:Ubiquitin-like protease family profile domain-containing protein n=1 Tax=Rubroshorea leprosula TaxID=152421 RepID=A0AAV5IR35_9ROSI|nr:hypothetical protein SLEP1_g14778 [Rubroshorea leprosula]
MEQAQPSRTRTAGCRRSNPFVVFDFAEEDERVEKDAEMLLCRFKQRKRRQSVSPIDNHTFLKCFAPIPTQQRVISSTLIDLDNEVAQGAKCRKDEISNGPVDIDVEVAQGAKSQKGGNGPIDVDAVDNEIIKKGISGQGLLSVPSNSECEEVGAISDDDDSIEISSPLASASSLAESIVSSQEQVLVYGTNGTRNARENKEVIISSDFIVYGEIYCTEAQLTFSDAALKVESSTMNGTDRTFSFEWAIDDIISIESEWCGRVETAFISLVLRSKDSKTAGNADETSVIESLRFSVYDSCWSEKQEAIQSLNVRYKGLWRITLDIDRENEGNALRGQHSEAFSNLYLSNLHECFEEVIYPEGDPDAILVRKRDVDLLCPETFINDTIIDFYIKYLKNKIQPEEQHRFYFFNSFFFRKLSDLDKYPSSACEARAAFQRVHKWTRKVDIFKKDYIFIPVNYSFHWSLIVICHPGEVANLKDDELAELPKVPCILHMDSIKGSHRGLKNLFQSYLCEEWKERCGGAADDISSKFFHLQFVPLELPQQENSFDCGLFLLHYVELFIHDAPTNFSPLKISKFSNFLTRNWFPPVEASSKRSHIQRLIYEVLKDQSYKASSASSVDGYPLFHSPQRIERETGLEVLGQDHSSNCNNAQEGIKISQSGAYPQTPNQQIEDSIAFEEFLKLGNYGRSLSDRNNCEINTLPGRNAMSPVEEVEVTCEKIAVDTSSEIDNRQVELQTKSPSRARFTGRYNSALEPPQNQQVLLRVGDSFSGSSGSDFQMLTEMRPEFEGCIHLDRTDKPESSSSSSEYLADCIVEDSEDDSARKYCESKRDPSSSCREIPALSYREAESKRNTNAEKHQILMINGDPAQVVVQVDE